MKKRTYTGIISIIITLLILQMIPLSSGLNNIEAKAAITSLKVLEIVDRTDDPSQLKDIKTGSNYSLDITTMPMKQFVAKREELDGKYDAIAITEGNYNSSGFNKLCKGCHDTNNLLNDITNLKADEIIKDFINKGQPVILHTESLKTGEKIKNKFGSLSKTSKSNVLLYEDSDDLKERLENFVPTNTKIRPKMMNITKPAFAKSEVKVPGNNLDFSFTINTQQKFSGQDLVARLYIDADFNDKYDTSEIVLEQSVTSKDTSISYKLPKGYSGIRNWKLELLDTLTNLKDYETGRIYFKDQTVNIKVLQVMPSSSASSLKVKENMTQRFLKADGEYDITIDAINMSNFTSNYYENLNGTYDMIIFGFGDSYNVNAKLKDDVVPFLNSFIASEQSIMFTHDTVFKNNANDNNNWVKNYMSATGQKTPQTDIGFGAPGTSTITKRINDGLLTVYPFDLKELERNENGGLDTNKEMFLKVATTHNQYFTLDLEDPDVTSWYNMVGSKRDVYDSYNHYYMYTKGNITYSGTGHQNKFPDSEQKLFVNTMYRAFLGSNHAPIITLITPKENESIPANQNIELSYKLEDFDLKDKLLSTKVTVDDKVVYTGDNIPKDTTVSTSIKHNLPDGGTAKIKIEATDARGAVATKEFTVRVVKINTNLEVSRTSDAPKPAKVGDPVTITYTVKPVDITGEAAKAIKDKNQVVLSDVQLSEKFPANLEVSAPGRTGSLQSGYTVNHNIGNIVYKKQVDKFVADPISYTLTVAPTEKGNYLLNSSVLKYTDVNKKEIQSSFNSLTIQADVPLKEVTLPVSYEMNKDSTKNFSLDLQYNPENAGIKEVKWSTADSNIVSIDPVTGAATAINEGTTTITAIVTDVFGNVKPVSTIVTVRVPVNSFTVEDITLKIGETKPIALTVDPDTESAKNSLSFKVGDEKIALFTKDGFKVTGVKIGGTFLTVSAIDKDGNKHEKEVRITVEPIYIDKLTTDLDVIRMKKGEVHPGAAVEIEPMNATDKTLEWISADPTVAEVDKETGVITATGTGKTKITVRPVKQRHGDSTVEATITVYVGQPLTGISVPPFMEVKKGGSVKIPVSYIPSDASDVKEYKHLYTSENEYIATVDEEGNVKGKRYGTVIIKTKVVKENGEPFTKETAVTVVESRDANQGRDKY